MNHKYIVQLTDEEREELRALIQKGRTQGYRIKHAQILLKLDEIPENQEWTYDKIKEAYHAAPHTISQIAKRFVTGGLEAALGRKEQVNRHRKIDGRVEAHIIAIACSEAPEGREWWTLQLIADELVRLGVVDSISDTAVMNTLKKTNLSLCLPPIKNQTFQPEIEHMFTRAKCPRRGQFIRQTAPARANYIRILRSND